MKVIVLAGAIALILSLVLTRLAISFMARHGYGQFIREDGPQQHLVKRGTPTMGGIAIIAAAVLAYFLAHLCLGTQPTASGLLVIFLFAGLGIVGFLDDFIKIRKERSLGLNARAKLAGQLAVGILFAVGALFVPVDETGLHPASMAVSGLRDIAWLDFGKMLPFWLATAIIVGWIIVIIMAASNAVNITDGLDGLSSGATMLAFLGYGLICHFQFNQACWRTGDNPGCYQVRDPLDLAVLSIAITFALLGFLWWNAKPAKIIMGDTGALALGGGLAGLAIMSKTELLLILMAGLCVIEILSVIIQVTSFKLRHGKRIFKMAPLHHHFEQIGWAEVTVVVRFWIIAVIFVGLALGVFYAEWVSLSANLL